MTIHGPRQPGFDAVLDGEVEVLIPRAPLPKPAPTTVLSVVIGPQETPPVICAVRYDQHLVYAGDPMYNEAPIWETHYVVMAIQDLPAGASYPEVAARVNLMAKRLYDHNDKGDYHLLADASDVGMPVVDTIKQSITPHCHVTAVTVTPNDVGDTSILWRTASTVGLLYLVSRVRAILQSGRLVIPESPMTAPLRDQFASYESGRVYSPDRVRALALCCGSEYAPVRYGLSLDHYQSPI